MAAVKTKKKKYSTVLTVLLIVLVCYFAATLIHMQTKVRAQERTVTRLSEQYDEKIDENENLSDILENGEDEDYMERIAREQYGYAMPDERVYYDSSDS